MSYWNNAAIIGVRSVAKRNWGLSKSEHRKGYNTWIGCRLQISRMSSVFEICWSIRALSCEWVLLCKSKLCIRNSIASRQVFDKFFHDQGTLKFDKVKVESAGLFRVFDQQTGRWGRMPFQLTAFNVEAHIIVGKSRFSLLSKSKYSSEH